MHALAILHRCLDALLTGVHRRRRETLFAAVTACVRGPRLMLTAIGRRFQSKTSLRHGIKRADRLLGNGKLQGETRTFYAALCRVLLAQTREARKLAERLDHPYSDAIAGYLALPTLGFCGDTAQLDRRARELQRLCAEQGYSLPLAWATCFEGWVAGARGNLAEGIALMERGVDAFRGTGTRAHLPHCLALLAELCLRAGRIDAASERLAEARAQAESSGERYWEAELHRLEGEVLLAAADDHGHDRDRRDRAEACFRRPLEMAGRQGATSLELRAALSLSRLGSSADAHQLLGEVVGRFTEGHDTADLRAAQTQLSLIHPPSDD